MPTKSPAASGTVRIIGGRLRGSKLPVLDRPGLRPSADRVRETLFNWLQHELAGASVIDLFAGSGALGIEAASRGAREVWLVERDAGLAASLRTQVQRLKIEGQVHVHTGDALDPGLAKQLPPVDLVFLDPPFAAGLWEQALAQAGCLLRPGGWLYLETPRETLPALETGWRLHREGHTRDVRYALYRAPAAGAS